MGWSERAVDRGTKLIDEGGSHIDLAPLRLAADAFLLGERVPVEPFEG
jgi:D-galactose 1-dehydrogenase